MPSRCPNSRLIVANIVSRSVRLLTSARRARLPARSVFLAACSDPSFKPQMATRAPSLSNSCAAASPIPLLPPVIRIFFSVSLPIVVTPLGWTCLAKLRSHQRPLGRNKSRTFSEIAGRRLVGRDVGSLSGQGSDKGSESTRGKDKGSQSRFRTRRNIEQNCAVSSLFARRPFQTRAMENSDLFSSDLNDSGLLQLAQTGGGRLSVNTQVLRQFLVRQVSHQIAVGPLQQQTCQAWNKLSKRGCIEVHQNTYKSLTHQIKETSGDDRILLHQLV